jgi:hypothetical protein
MQFGGEDNENLLLNMVQRKKKTLKRPKNDNKITKKGRSKIVKF